MRDEERRDAVAKTSNDVAALNLGLRRLAELPVSLHDHLLSVPLTTAAAVQRVLDVSQPTADRLLRDLGDIDVLTEITGRQRNQQWLYGDYLGLFRPEER